MSKTSLQKLKEVHEIQGNSGNYDWSPYMLGLFNGLELALSIFEDREPAYREVKSFREDHKRSTSEVSAIESDEEQPTTPYRKRREEQNAKVN